MNPFTRFIAAPERLARLEFIRIAAPLAILGFLSSRLAHAGEWVGDAGYRLPLLDDVMRQPVFLPALPGDWATIFAALVIASALAVSIGFHARKAALLLAVLVIYAALGDRLSTFTVTKLTPMIALALAASPCGARYSVDAWRARRRAARADSQKNQKPEPPPELVSGGIIRYFQAFLCVFYAASGFCKVRGDWLEHPTVLFTHLHDSMQTPLSTFFAENLPVTAWTVAQGAVLAFEVGAPLWLGWRKTRPYALVFALGMHLFIGGLFWPVRYFALLMCVLLIGAFLPDRFFLRAETVLARVFARRPAAPAVADTAAALESHTRSS